MKYLWETHDVVAGRQVDSHNRAERYIIGYDVSLNECRGNLILVSLRDGMLARKEFTHKEMARYLTESGMRPVGISEEDVAP